MRKRGLIAAVVALAALAVLGGGWYALSARSAVQPRQTRPYEGGTPFQTKYLLALPAGNGSLGIPLYKAASAGSEITLEAVIVSRDGSHFWVVDHPVGDTPRTRVRRFALDGTLKGTFDAPLGSTLFTPGRGDDLWAAVSSTTARGEYLVHFDAAGKLLGRYPLPQYAYTSSISIDSSGAAWILNDEWSTDPDTFIAAWTGALLPIVDENGDAVVDVAKRAVAGGAFIGFDGRLYSLEATVAAQTSSNPRWHVIVRDKKGVVEDYKLASGLRPFAADERGRVYAKFGEANPLLPVGVSSLGDPAGEAIGVSVIEHGKQTSLTYVQDFGPRTQAYPPVSVTVRGDLLSPVWDDGALQVALSSRVRRDAAVPPASVPPSPDAKVLFAGGMPLSGDPYLARDEYERDLWKTVYSGLARYDESLVATPDLAVALPAPGEGISADGKTLTWRIDTKRKWHDGSPVSAQDVVETWRHLLQPSTVMRPEPFPGFRYITDVSAVGDTVTVKLSQPFGAAPEAFFPYVLPRSVLKSAEAQFNGGLFDKPVGTGPYRMVRWGSDGVWSLEASKYAKRAPKISKLEVDFVKVDDAARVYAESAVPVLWAWVPEQDATALKSNPSAGTQTKSPTGRWWGVVFNTQATPMNDADARARWLSIYPGELGLKHASQAGSSTAEAGPFLTAVAPVDTSIARGASAVAELKRYYMSRGWRDSNKDGYLDLSGKGLRFSFAQSFRWRLHEYPLDVVDTAIANMLKVGFIEDNPSGTHNYYSSVPRLGALSRGTFMVGAGVFPAFRDAGWGSMFDPQDTPAWTNPYGRNVTFTRDKELARLHAQARSSYDPEERAKISRAISARVRELNLAYFEREEQRISAVRGIAGYEPARYPAGDFWNVEEWSVDK